MSFSFSTERSFVDVKTDQLNACACENKPTEYGVGFGSTPYSVYCSGCKKNTNRYREVGGSPQNIIDFWNLIAPLKELEELTYRVGNEKFTWKDSWKMRCYMLDNNDYKVFVLFDGGEIEFPDYKKFLHKHIDY